jgi:NAD(P)-dependent dehydrogenase (short-subunit alcohol dehydrogenase family)
VEFFRLKEMFMTDDMLNHKNCLITGGSRGLGAKIATAFWENGANLFLVSRSQQALEALASFLPERANQSVHLFPADLSDSTAPGRIMAGARQAFDRIDVLVNNAAIQGPIGPAWENEWTGWLDVLQVDLLAPIDLCRQVIPWMASKRAGKLINISGGGGTGPRPNFSAYATAKSGLIRFSETLAQEVISLGIDVNCVAPGAMGTDMLAQVVEAGSQQAGEKEYQAALKAHEAGKLTMEKAARLCVFLASFASDQITGKLISAVWDAWEHFPEHLNDLQKTDIYTLRRIVPKDRALSWGDL